KLFGDGIRLRGTSIGDLPPFNGVGVKSVGAEGCGGEAVWDGTIETAAGGPLDVEVSRVSLVEDHGVATDVYIIHDVSPHAELSRLREELLHNIAHELRRPLTVVEGSLELLHGSYADLPVAEFDELMSSARRNLRRLDATLDELLNAGTIQAGRFVVRLKRIDLKAVIDETLELLEPALRQRGQRIDVSVSERCHYVRADRTRAWQVLSNLLANASKYGPEGETIHLTAERLESHVRISVVDRGPGIPEAQQDGLFERFYRARAAGEAPGVGLGLAIAKGIVDAHGGQIGLESEVGMGTTVWFTLEAEEQADD
ncbi:MAG: histidine kinase, partial [Chloroflexi bacterium]|nr:histidine kinase [Chloroflexota bacterium]